MADYEPTPVDTSTIELDEELNSLIEKLANNIHENWAKERIEQGWKYGEVRDDKNKLHPCLKHYDELSEEDKKIDRKSAIETIKLLINLGYKIVKA